MAGRYTTFYKRNTSSKESSCSQVVREWRICIEINKSRIHYWNRSRSAQSAFHRTVCRTAIRTTANVAPDPAPDQARVAMNRHAYNLCLNLRPISTIVRLYGGSAALKNSSTKEQQVLLLSYQWCLRMSMVDTYINGTAPNSPFFQSKFYDHKLVLPKIIKQTKPKMINITGFLSATCGR